MICEVTNWKDNEDGSATCDVEYDEAFLAEAKKWYLEKNPDVELKDTDNDKVINEFLISLFKDYIAETKENDSGE